MRIDVQENTFFKNLQKETDLIKRTSDYEALIIKISDCAQSDLYDAIATRDKEKIKKVILDMIK